MNKELQRLRGNQILIGIGVPGLILLGLNFNYHFIGTTYVLLISLAYFVAFQFVNGKALKAQTEQMDRGEFPPPKPGICPNCSYDRKGLDANARCPECGMPPPTVEKNNDPES